MASCTSSSWTSSSTSPRIKLVVTENTNTDTYVKYNWALYYIAASAASSSVAKSWTVKVDDGTATGTFAIGGKTGTHLIKSGTKTIQRGTSARTITFSCSMNIDITWSGVKKTTISASGTFTLGKKTSYTVSYNANGGSGAPSSQTKWYGTNLTLSTTKPTRSGYTFLGWGTSASDTSVNYAAGASYTSNAGVTLYAIWSKTLTLTYSANGGSGAPASQSSTIYNATTSKAFTLSSTKPTKTGYTFLGWSTSSTATSASYASGASITISANTTLYAVWKIITYTVSYSANGGSGAPSSQTKKYGTALTLSSVKPTRTNYNFKGWATSATGAVAYASGASYTSNANITLYAVWEIAYIKPRITNFTVERYAYEVDSEGTIITDEYSDIGECVYISFNWASDYAVSSVTGCYRLSTASDSEYSELIELTSTTAEDGKSGTVSGRYFDNLLSIENGYVIKVKVTDTFDTTVNYSEATKTLPATKFILDFFNGGKGVAFGKPAELSDYLDNGFKTRFRQDAELYSGVMYFGSAKTYYFSANTGNVSCNTLTAAGATALKSTLAVTGNTTLTGWLKPNGGVYLPNNGIIYGYTTGGSALDLLRLNSSNNMIIGYGGYNSSVGGSYLYGNSVNLVSKGNVNVTGPIKASSTITASTYSDAGNAFRLTPAYTTEVALCCHWKDSSTSYHNIVGRATDGLSAYFGWNGSSTYTTRSTLRGYSVRLSCGGNAGTDTKYSIDFEYDGTNVYLRPCVTSGTYLGSGSYRWLGIYSAAAVNVSSDGRLKHNVNYDIEDEACDLIYNSKPTSFIYNYDDKNIKRYGMIAQDVKDYLIKNNKEKFGGLSIDGVNGEMNLELDANEDDVTYGIAYEQYIAPLICVAKKQKREIDTLKNTVDKQNEKIISLEERVSKLEALAS